jgi:hypothetical protein
VLGAQGGKREAKPLLSQGVIGGVCRGADPPKKFFYRFSCLFLGSVSTHDFLSMVFYFWLKN